MTEREALDLAATLNLPRPVRTREPGRRALIILGEIADAHLRGVRWHARERDGRFSAWKIHDRASHAQRMRDVYRWVTGNSRQGYVLVACPRCRVVTCFESECQKVSGHDARA